VAALAVARELQTGTVVVIFPDFGDRYMSTNLWRGWKPSELPGVNGRRE
jgi:hypothetical protein